MKKKAKKDTPVSWTDIQDEASRSKRPVTVPAMKRKLVSLCRLLSVIFILLFVGSVFAFLIANNTGTIEKTEVLPMGHKIDTLVFNTDGCLDEQWFREHFFEWEEEDLMHLDLVELKSDIEKQGQVVSVDVSRNLPGELILDVLEEKPLMKVMMLENNQKNLYLVSTKGTIYRGSNYDLKMLKKLPFLGGTVLKRDANGDILPLKDIDIVAKLLLTAERDYPEIFATWRVVSFKKFKEDPFALDSLIIVNSTYVKEVIFAPSKFDLQLSRLEEIIEKAKEAKRNYVERIDISFEDQAFVSMLE